MSECDLVCQFFVRALSGVVALVVGTGLCYVLFIGGYLRGIEHYKQRLRVYKRLDMRIEKMLRYIGFLKKNARWADYFAKEGDVFNNYVKGEDRLFMSASLKRHCQQVIKALDELPPHSYESPRTVVGYSKAKLSNVQSEVESLRKLIEDEIETTRFGVPPKLAESWFRIRRRWSFSGKDKPLRERK